MTRVVDRLVERKLVRRLPDQQDRRISKIEVLARGRSLARRIRKFMIAREKLVLEALSPGARQSLIEGLRELSKTVDHWRSGGLPPEKWTPVSK